MNVSDDILKAAGVSWAKRKAIKLATSISPAEKTNYFVKDNLIICDDGKEKDTLKISNDGKYLYGKFEKTRNGFIAKFDGGELSSKTLVEGPAALFEAGVINLNASCYFSEEHTEWGVGANLGSIGFESGFQIGNTRFTIGGELAAGINFGYRRETTDNKSSYQVRLPILKSLRFTIEK